MYLLYFIYFLFKTFLKYSLLFLFGYFVLMFFIPTPIWMLGRKFFRIIPRFFRSTSSCYSRVIKPSSKYAYKYSRIVCSNIKNECSNWKKGIRKIKPNDDTQALLDQSSTSWKDYTTETLKPEKLDCCTYKYNLAIDKPIKNETKITHPKKLFSFKYRDDLKNEFLFRLKEKEGFNADWSKELCDKELENRFFNKCSKPICK